MSDVYQVAAPFQVILLRQRVKELEAEIEQLSSVSLADECEEWETTLAEARAEERERCCQAVCSHCADGVPVQLIDTQWYHPIDRQSHSDDGFVECDAQAVREADDG